MDRFAVRVGLVALVAGGCLTAYAAEPIPSEKLETKPWYSRLMGDPKPKPDADKTFAATPPRPTVALTLDPAVLTDALRAEQEAWDRRMEVCRRLREVASPGDSEAITKQANDLEKQATALYHQRVARLGVKGPMRGPVDSIDRVLGSGAALDPTQIATPKPTLTDKTATAQNRAFKVVNP